MIDYRKATFSKTNRAYDDGLRKYFLRIYIAIHLLIWNIYTNYCYYSSTHSIEVSKPTISHINDLIND